MKKTIFLVTALSGILSAGAMTDAEFKAAYQKIRSDKANQPRYCQFRHDLILADLAAFGRTNELTYAQRAGLAARVAEHALAEARFAREYAAAMAEIRAVTNAPLKVATLSGLFDAYLHTYSFSRPRSLPEAERILAEIAPAVDMRRQLQMRLKFVEVGLATWRDRAKAAFDREYALVRDFEIPANLSGPQRLALERQKLGTIGGFLAALVSVDPEGANALFAKDGAQLDAGAKNAFRNAVADNAIKMKDRPLFDEILKGVLAEPVAAQVAGLYRPLLGKLFKFDPETAREIVAKSLADKALSPSERMFFLSVRQGFDDPPIFDYGFNAPGRYGRWRAALLERKAIAEANPTNRACVFYSNARAIAWETERLIWYDDLKTAGPIVAEALARWPDDRKLRLQEAQVCAIEGDRAGAIASLGKSLSIRGTKADETNRVARVIAFLKGEGLGGFDRVNAPLGLTGAQRLKALRETSNTLFTYRLFDDCRAIYSEIVGKMYRPDPRKSFTATPVKNAPQTAGAFAVSPFYADWKNYETRFAPYGDCYGESAEADAKWHLKDAKRPVCESAWQTGVAVLYDDEGVHIFIRCDDPEIAEVKNGQRSAGGLELFFAPGGLEVPYHSIFFNDLPDVDDPHDSEWCSPGRHYRRNRDSFAKDAALTPEGVVAHVSVPWMSFYDSLPIEGNVWNLGVIRNCKSGMQTSGGVVHELSRGLQLRFELSPERLVALKRKVSVVAYNRYRKIREAEGGFIQRWNDPLLGDRAFYAAEVAPLLERLDKAGERLLKPCPDSEIDAIFAEETPLWAEIGYEIAERRTRYLNDRLFREE